METQPQPNTMRPAARVRELIEPLTRAATKMFTIRYDTRCYFNVRSKASMSQLNLPHGTVN